jgi:hypothetical protein
MLRLESIIRLFRPYIDTQMAFFYTYMWLREDGTPYYVGKGHGKRAFERANHRFCPPTDPVNILIQEWPDEMSAFEGEKLLIAIYGRKDIGTGCLRNLTEGGENPPRSVKGSRSAEFCRQVSERKKGNTNNLGKKFSVEHRGRIAAALRGKPLSAERKANISAARLGKFYPKYLGMKNHTTPHTAETKEKMRAARNAHLDREFLKTVSWG